MDRTIVVPLLTFTITTIVSFIGSWFISNKLYPDANDENPATKKKRLELDKRKPSEVWNTVLFFPDLYYPMPQGNSKTSFHPRPEMYDAISEQERPQQPELKRTIDMLDKVKLDVQQFDQPFDDDDDDDNNRRRRGRYNKELFPTHPNSPTVQFLNYFEQAKFSIYIAIQLVSFSPLTNILLKKHDEGYIIKIVTDFDSSKEHNITILHLKRRGFHNVRVKNFGYLMHNKFAIFDDEAVLTGSMNWTKQAFRGNHENIAITTNQKIVSDYIKEFHKLWTEGDQLEMKRAN